MFPTKEQIEKALDVANDARDGLRSVYWFDDKGQECETSSYYDGVRDILTWVLYPGRECPVTAERLTEEIAEQDGEHHDTEDDDD